MWGDEYNSEVFSTWKITCFKTSSCQQCYSIPESVPASSAYPLCLCSCFRLHFCIAAVCVQPSSEWCLVGPGPRTVFLLFSFLSEIIIIFAGLYSTSRRKYLGLLAPQCLESKRSATALPTVPDGLRNSESAVKDCDQNSVWWGGREHHEEALQTQTLGNTWISFSSASILRNNRKWTCLKNFSKNCQKYSLVR